jgi:hypothetical protein
MNVAGRQDAAAGADATAAAKPLNSKAPAADGSRYKTKRGSVKRIKALLQNRPESHQ